MLANNHIDNFLVQQLQSERLNHWHLKMAIGDLSTKMCLNLKL